MPGWKAWACRLCRRSPKPSGCISRRAPNCSAPFGLDGVVALTRLHLQVLVRYANIEFSEAAVFVRIRGRVADGILAAHFILQLLEHVFERMVAVHLVDMPAGLVGHLLQCEIADMAEGKWTVGAGVGIVDAID